MQVASGNKQENNNKSRYTIGLLFDNLYENYGAMIWGGVVEYAREQDLNLICFSGGSLHSPDPFYAQRNVIYDLVSMNNVDGLVAISSSIGNYLEQKELNTFYARYKPLPLVSIGVPIAGSPCVMVDNEYGTRALMEHLVKVHGYRNIAFISGPKVNPEAETRLLTYKKILEENGIPFDPAMVAPGTFDNWAGTEAVKLLFDERELDIDALFVANDYMALYAIKALQQRGIKVPEDVAVVGFDDIKEASGIIPSLTTVHQPLFELGRETVRTLHALLKGESGKSGIMLATKLVIRRSCGCFTHTKIQSPVHSCTATAPGSPADAAAKEFLAAGVVKTMKSSFINLPPAEVMQEWAELLCGSVLECLHTSSGEKILVTLENLLSAGSKTNMEVSDWYGIVSHLFGIIVNHDQFRAQAAWIDDLWKESLVFIGRYAEQHEFLKRINESDQAVKLNKVSQALITAFNKNSLKKVIIEELPNLGISSCFISLYVGNRASRQFTRLFLSYNNYNRMLEINDDSEKFSSHQLIPGSLKSLTGRFAFLVMPLCFKTEQLGFILFEIGPREAIIYETLTNQLSGALKGAKLVKNRKRLEMEILEISGREQQRIGQDLHDGLGQILTGVTYLCKVLEEQLRSKNLVEAESMAEISRLINQSIAQTRNLARGLFPVELEQNGLLSALEELCRKTKNQFKIPCRFRCEKNVLIKDNSRALHLYRIAQEAVNNAVKHSGADRIEIELHSSSKQITLLVNDNGIGIRNTPKARKGMGLRIMKYRANMIGARFEIRQNKIRGTSVICSYKKTPGKDENPW